MQVLNKSRLFLCFKLKLQIRKKHARNLFVSSQYILNFPCKDFARMKNIECKLIVR